MIKGPLTPVKVFHWSLAASVVFSWLAADELELWHEYAGYLALALIAARLVWAAVGSKSAGLGRHVQSARKALADSRDVVLRRASRPLRPYPFISLTAVALLITITATGVTGWLAAEPARLAMLPDFPAVAAPAFADGYEYDDDDDDRGERGGGHGSEAMEEIHEFLADFLLLIIFSHVALVIYVNLSGPGSRPNRTAAPTGEGG